MNVPPLQTAADLLVMLDQKTDITAQRRRDLVSAVNRICDLVGCAPASLRLEVPGLRTRLASIRPAAHGVSPKTFANVRSLFISALEWAGAVEPTRAGVARKDPTWAPLVAGMAGSKRLSLGMAAFTNWCAANGIGPTEVGDAELERFGTWLGTRTLYARPRDVIRDTPRFWNEAARTVPGWPASTLSLISFRPASPNLGWEELPAGLRTEAEAYLALRANPDPFDNDPNAPNRPLAASTIRQQKEHIRLAVSVLLQGGTPAETLTSLTVLVEPDAFKAVLRHYHVKADGKANAFVVALAKTLIDVARYQVRVSDARLAELKKLASRLPPVPFDLTKKNKALLHELEDERMRARLVYLPDQLMRDVKAKLKSGARLRHAEAQVAVAIELLLSAPLRPQNLVDLNWSRNFKEPQGPKGNLLLYIPKDATKTKRRELIFEIPPELAANLRFYRREVLPQLGGDPNGDLFVVKGGGRKSQETLSEQITEAVRKVVGIHMTPHQFRHVAAMLYLDEHPEDFQTVTDLLGHAWSKTTQIYAGASTRRASRAYGAHVMAQREALILKRPRGRVRRRP